MTLSQVQAETLLDSKTNEKVPSLTDVLRLVKNTGALLNIDHVSSPGKWVEVHYTMEQIALGLGDRAIFKASFNSFEAAQKAIVAIRSRKLAVSRLMKIMPILSMSALADAHTFYKSNPDAPRPYAIEIKGGSIKTVPPAA